jgi:methionyl-tRNA formyltransferase
LKVAIITSLNQWFVPYAKELSNQIKNSRVLFDHTKIKDGFDVLFILSYHKVIPKNFLKKNRHNIVVHASDLPKGKGWSPMFWQILEGKNSIVFTMFEADTSIDSGGVYMKRTLQLDGFELNKELRKKQADFIVQMCFEFLNGYEKFKTPKPQKGKESFYPKRTAKDSRLDIDKTIKEQFNLLRIVDNEEYPAFFEIDNHHYILKIEKVKDEDR